MGSFTKFFNSSIGKKFFMAITGSFLIIFLIVHFIGNIFLFFGPEAFNDYVKALDAIKPIIRVIEVVLVAAFVIHIFNGVRVWWENKKTAGGGFVRKYKVNVSNQYSSFSVRTSFITGVVIFIFLVQHLATFFWRYNVSDSSGLADKHEYFKILVEYFQIWWVVLFYVIAVLLLGFHLNHGFQSAFQTFGWNNSKYFPFVKKCGTVYAIITALGFASMPIYIFFTYGGGL